MNNIAYVVLSDLHFGASNSLLSALVDGDADQVRPVDTQSPSPVLTAFLDSVAVLVERNEGSTPTLILAGDVLDLALSTDDVAAMVFNQFARRAFGETPLFADNVIFVPGNHDHHLWETARESQYAAYLLGLPSRDSTIEPAWHTTRMRADNDAQTVESSIIEALIFKQTGRDVKVRVVYPNLALNDSTGQRCVVVHHGHFTESMYLLMSRLKDVVFPEQRTAGLPHVWEWEAENFAWIDFFWSALGRSGGVGADVGLVYAQLRSPECLKRYVDNVIAAMVGHEHAPHWLKHLETDVLDGAVGSLLRRSSTFERASTDRVLTPAGVRGLREYLDGPLYDQLLTEYKGQVPDDVTFIFGHTHKPFVRTCELESYRKAVTVFNTGGWVVDTAAPAPVHGAAAVLISTELEVVSLRVYNQTADHSAVPVRLDGTGEWCDDLNANLGFGADEWAALSDTAARSVAHRNQLAAAYQRGE